MLVLPGLTFLILFVAYINPLDIWEGFGAYPYVHVGLLLAMFGLYLDSRRKEFKLYLAPQFWLVIAFVVWCMFTDLMHNPAQLKGAGNIIVMSTLLFLLISHGCQTFRAIRFLTWVILLMDLSAGYCAVGQAFGPYTCTAGGKHINFIDDRECDPDDRVEGSFGVGFIPRACTEGEEALEDVTYKCERRGPFGFNTVEGRSTGFGWLTDPNDVALATGIGLPFAFAYREQKKESLSRLVVLLLTVALFGLAAVFTKSRGGQIVYGVVLMVYFVRKYGLKGAFVAVAMAAPLAVLGGRSGVEASNSANHRLELWQKAVDLLVSSPITGVGCKEFMKHSTDACHNAYANAFAELGLPGYFLYLSVVYMCLKIPWMAFKHCNAIPEARIGRIYSLALFAALIGQQVGLLFLSQTYNFTAWVHFGLTGALHTCVKKHSPGFKVTYSRIEFVFVAIAGLAFIAAIVLVNKLFPPTLQTKVFGQ